MKPIRRHIPEILSTLIALTLGASAQDAVDPYKKASVAAPMQPASDRFLQVSIETHSFSLPINDAFTLLRENPTDGARFKRLIELMKEGAARLERILVVRDKSGQRCILESIVEMRYPTEYGLASGSSTPSADRTSTPEPGKDLQPFPQKFETRNAGDTLEVEPIVRADNITVDLILAPQSVHYLGQKEPEGAPGFYQPVFGTRKATTSVAVRVGAPLLISVTSPTFNSDLAKAQEERRVWLQFVTAQTVDTSGIPFQESDGPTAAAAKAAIIDSIDFVNATPKEAVELLRSKSAEHSPDGKAINIVLKLPPSLDQSRVNLSLKAVSVYDALRYMAASIGAEVTAEDPALIVHVKGDRP